jgi:hypothetical protein
MRSLFQALVALFALVLGVIGCGKSTPPSAGPASARDVTLIVPGMH